MPFLGDIPLIGYLFKRHGAHERKDRAADLPHAAHRQGVDHRGEIATRPSPLRPLPARGEWRCGEEAIYYNAAVPLHRGNLFLVGLMGAASRRSAASSRAASHKRFVDADHELEERLGVTIPTIFEIEGEAGFRDREEAMHRRPDARSTDVVLATGGGAVLRPASRERLKANGTVIYLHADPATLWRARAPQPAPADAAGRRSARSGWPSCTRSAMPLYREVADHVVESEREAGDALRAARSNAATRRRR